RDTRAQTWVLQRFGFQFSSLQPTPLSTGHSLSAPPSDESVEPSGPYQELLGCLMYLMTCTRPDLAYPLSLLARYVAPVVLTGHADASWVDDLATQRSSQGYTFSLGVMAAQELRWLTYMLTDLGEQPRSPLAVSDTTQQTFDAAGFKILPDVIGSLAQGCRGSSPSANDADNAPRREASRQRGKRPGGVVEAGGEESISAKRSKGPGGSQQPTVVAATVEGTHRTVTPHVAAPTSSVPPTAPPIAARPPANPTSALLLAQLGARSAAAPTPSQPEAKTIATPTSGNVSVPAHGAAVVNAAAEKGVRAALATGGKPLDKDFHDADIAAIRTHLDAATCTGQPPALAISDTAHVEPSASPARGSAEPKSATDAAGEGSLKRKGKADIRKGKASSQRKTRTISATKDKAVENQDEKSVGEGKLAKNGKEKAVENQAEKSVGEGKPEKKGKDKAAEKEKEKEKGRKGHGIRHDSLGDRKGWVGEIKVPSNSRDKMELACLHSIAYILYNGYVSKVLMDELTDLEETKMEKWRKVWEEVRFMPTGMWTLIWARGVYLPKSR
ncbi:unnamed protein product, partial [Closterium sp. NIES-53]